MLQACQSSNFKISCAAQSKYWSTGACKDDKKTSMVLAMTLVLGFEVKLNLDT